MNKLMRLAYKPSRTLLLVQLGAVLLYPWFDGPGGHLVLSGISVFVLSAAVLMVRHSPRETWIALTLAVLGVVAFGLYRLTGSTTLGVIGAAGYASAFFYSAIALVGYMLQDERTTVDEMWAAGATFMLFAEAYAWLFMGLQLLRPDAFVVAGSAGPMSWVQLLFLSSANFSATGLSDIYPGIAHARVLLVVEQWNGVMYLAIVVARLAGMLRATPRS